MRVTDEGERLRALLTQGARSASGRGKACPGRFLSGSERPLALRAAREEGVEAFFEGGWAEAERFQVCFAPEGLEPCFTAQWLRVKWDARFAQVNHRDLLGSLMGLGIDRLYAGDLVLQDDMGWLYALPELAARLPEEWREAGRVPIRVTVAEEAPVLRAPHGELIRDTVASLRLDCVLSSGLRLSRAKAAELIRAGRVAVNHLPEERVDVPLAEGDLLSIRGAGRVRLKGVGDKIRHGRTGVELERFLKDK